MPTAAETKFWTARPAICVRWPIVASPEYACQLVLVTNDAAVLNASAGSTPGNPSDSGRSDWNRCSAYSSTHADEREGEHRRGVHRPALVGARVDSDDAVDDALDAQVALAW